MKITPQKSVLTKTLSGFLIAGIGGSALFGSTNAASAQNISRGPVISPSIIAAHRLKYYPPRGWLRHYMGDDRYKIGSVWRVVTTPNDKFYYPPFAREMLMTPPDRIIGFASAQDAVEAGYSPASQYGAAFGLDVHQMAVSDAQNNPEKSSGASSNVTTINRTKKSQRITLADGVSTVLLPPNWKRTRSSSQAIYGNVTQKSDELQSLSGGGSLEFSSLALPAGMNGNVTTPLKLAPLLERGGQNGIALRNATLGGLSGSLLTPKNGATLPLGMGEKTIVVGRGGKAYTLSFKGKNVAGAQTIINSFRPR